MPHRPDHPFADPTAEPAPQGSSSDAGRSAPTRELDNAPAAEPAATALPVAAGPGGHAPGQALADGGYELAHPTGPGDPYAAVWPAAAPSRRPWRRTLRVAVLTGVVVLVLGAPLGLLWHWLAPSVPVLDAGSSGIVVNDPSPEEYVAADGWYTLLGLGFGLLVAIVAWLVMRKDRGPFLLLGVVLGALGAGYVIAPWIGGLIGRGDYHHWVHTAVQGATYMAPPQVHSVGPRLVPAFAAAIVLTLLAGWSNDPDLDEPGAHPGYGAHTGHPGEPGCAETGS